MSNRDIYRRLALLNTEGSQKILDKELDKISQSVQSAGSNDEVYKQLEVLSRFAFRDSKETLKLLNFVIYKLDLPQKTYETEYGPYEGHSKEDLILKALELLDGIRYHQTSSIVRIYRDLFKKKEYRKKIEDYLRNISEYNYDATQRIGYYAQRQVINVLHKRNIVKNNDLEFYILAVQHIASTEATYHHMKDEKTLVWGSAGVVFNEQLKEIRSDVIEKLQVIYYELDDLKAKEQTISALEGFTSYHFRSGNELSDPMKKLIKSNAYSIFEFYGKIVREGVEQNLPLFPLYLAMEEDLGIFESRHDDPKLNELINSIGRTLDSSEGYTMYRGFAGERMLVRNRKKELTYEEAHKQLEEYRNGLFEQIDSKGIKKLEPLLAAIAEYEGIEERWRLNNFYSFISRIAHEKPTVAYSLLTGVYSQSFKKTLGSFIVGFARGNRVDEFYKTVDIAIEQKSVDAVISICFAVTFMPVDQKSTNVISDILNKSGDYKYLKGANELYYIDNLAEACIYILRETGEAELLESFLLKYASHGQRIIGTFDMALFKKDLPKLTKQIEVTLWQILLAEPTFDYHCEKLLLHLTQKDLRKIIEFFDARIKMYITIKKNNKKARYDAVPYHMGGLFKEEVYKTPKDYKDIFIEVIEGFSEEWTYRDSEISSVLKSVGNYKSALKAYLASSKDKYAGQKALTFCSGIDSTDTDIVMAIVARLPKAKWSSAFSLIYNTGMVSGEYGLANAHKFKKQEIEKKYLNSDNKKIREFAKDSVKHLENSIKAEIQRTDERNRLERMEYED